MLSDVVNDIVGDIESVGIDFILEDILAQLEVWSFDFRHESPFESREEPVFYFGDLGWHAVAGEDYLFSRLVEVVEDIKKGILSGLLTENLLDIVHDEQVDGLVEIDKIVDGRLSDRVGVLQLKEVGGDVEHTQGRILGFGCHADSVYEVCLTHSGRSVNEGD